MIIKAKLRYIDSFGRAIVITEGCNEVMVFYRGQVVCDPDSIRPGDDVLLRRDEGLRRQVDWRLIGKESLLQNQQQETVKTEF